MTILGRKIETIVAIESSCDDFCFAVLDKNDIVLSQAIRQTHKGGVHPEYASRMHVKALPHFLNSLPTKFDAIAVTDGPGLPGSLNVGMAIAKSISWVYDVPLIFADHIDGHILTPLWSCTGLELPYLCLVASGGHTLLAYVESTDSIKIIGGTRDDAAGEALDKIGRMLGLEYPGGPEIERIAKDGSPRHEIPIPMKHHSGYDVSFSGLKEHVRKCIAKDPNLAIADWAASAQDAVGETLCVFLEKGLALTGLKRVGFSGGVAINLRIRSMLQDTCAKHGASLYCPPREFCGDNAAMIAWCARWKAEKGQFGSLDAKARQRYDSKSIFDRSSL